MEEVRNNDSNIHFWNIPILTNGIKYAYAGIWAFASFVIVKNNHHFLHGMKR